MRVVRTKRALAAPEKKTLFLLQLYENESGLKIRWRVDAGGTVNAAKIKLVEIAAGIFARSIGAEVE